MHIYAGKTETCRYDNRAPVHLALSDEDEDGVISDIRAVCSDRSVAPLAEGGRHVITCTTCQSIAVDLLAVGRPA